jgi:hypothetical protein
MPQRQACLAIKAINAFVVVLKAFPAQHHMNSSIPVMDAGVSDFLDP